MRADAMRNRERVLEVAREAFAAEGLTVPLDEIARRAGVGPGTLYRHFPTKEALLGAVMHDRMRRLAQEGTELVGSADPGAAFFAFIDRIAAEAGPKRDIFEALASAGVSAGQEVASAVEDLRVSLATLLEQAQKAGAVRTDIGPVELTALLSGMLFAIRPRRDADMGLVIEVFKDALRASAVS
jgi:AcrR family transcriptional regulator